MIQDYNLKKVGCDFMGYRTDRASLSAVSRHPIQFHHLIIPMRECAEIESHGYVEWNGALLMRDSHEYLHKIEMYERYLFDIITECMVEMNKNGKLDKENLLKIRACLLEFEQLHKNTRTRKGGKLVKDCYKTLRLTPSEIHENKYL